MSVMGGQWIILCTLADDKVHFFPGPRCLPLNMSLLSGIQNIHGCPGTWETPPTSSYQCDTELITYYSLSRPSHIKPVQARVSSAQSHHYKSVQ